MVFSAGPGRRGHRFRARLEAGSDRSHTSTRHTSQNLSAAGNLSQAQDPAAGPSPGGTRADALTPRPAGRIAGQRPSAGGWVSGRGGAGRFQSLSRVRSPLHDPAVWEPRRAPGGWGLRARGSRRQRRQDAGAGTGERWPPRGWRRSRAPAEVRGGPPAWRGRRRGAGGGAAGEAAVRTDRRTERWESGAARVGLGCEPV